jgi:hypothetical protein
MPAAPTARPSQLRRLKEFFDSFSFFMVVSTLDPHGPSRHALNQSCKNGLFRNWLGQVDPLAAGAGAPMPKRRITPFTAGMLP